MRVYKANQRISQLQCICTFLENKSIYRCQFLRLWIRHWIVYCVIRKETVKASYSIQQVNFSWHIIIQSCNAQLVEQGVWGSIPGLATWISETGYLLIRSRDMTERLLKRRKSSIQNLHLRLFSSQEKKCLENFSHRSSLFDRRQKTLSLYTYTNWQLQFKSGCRRQTWLVGWLEYYT